MLVENIWMNIIAHLLNSLKFVVVCVGVVFKKNQFWMNLKKKDFNSFISNVKGWKLMDNLNKFEIFPLDLLETVDS